MTDRPTDQPTKQHAMGTHKEVTSQVNIIGADVIGKISLYNRAAIKEWSDVHHNLIPTIFPRGGGGAALIQKEPPIG